MKRVYFVRHGESAANIDRTVQGPNDPLTERGRMQATKIAERCQNISFQKLIASPLPRAQDTAAAIAEATNIPVTTLDCLFEARRPSSLVGHSHDSEKYLSFLAEAREHAADPSWHFEDEENYTEVLARAEKALAIIEADEAEEILAVTHGHFLRFLTTYILVCGEMTPELWHHTSKTLLTINTAITVFQHDGTMWKLLTYNDHAHFAE